MPTAQDSTVKMGRYTVQQKAAVRAGVEIGSENLGQLEVGQEVRIVEQAVDSNGRTRLRFSRPKIEPRKGWVSLQTRQGAPILEKVVPPPPPPPITLPTDEPAAYKVSGSPSRPGLPPGTAAAEGQRADWKKDKQGRQAYGSPDGSRSPGSQRTGSNSSLLGDIRELEAAEDSEELSTTTDGTDIGDSEPPSLQDRIDDALDSGEAGHWQHRHSAAPPPPPLPSPPPPPPLTPTHPPTSPSWQASANAMGVSA